jgi:hypothetical protein
MARSGTLIIVTPPCQLTETWLAPDLFALTEATSKVAGDCALDAATNVGSISVNELTNAMHRREFMLLTTGQTYRKFPGRFKRFKKFTGSGGPVQQVLKALQVLKVLKVPGEQRCFAVAFAFVAFLSAAWHR